MNQPVGYDNELSYWEKRLGADVPLNSVGYRGLSDSFVAWLYRVRARRFTAVARPYVKPQMRVLDVGSGGGFYVSLWKQLGVTDVTATDLTQASLRALNRRFSDIATAPFDIGAPELPFAAESFDAISCMDVVHHLMDDGAYQRAFENCARLLRPGGVLIFTDNFLHGPAYRGPHHVSRSLIHIEQVVRAADLRLEQRVPMFVIMNNPIDSRNPLFKFYWRAMNFALRNGTFGKCAGMLLYPLEISLTSILREGPSTEIGVARKK